jgi:transposase
MNKRSQNRSYTPEFKREAVQLALDSSSVSSAAQDLGIPEATLHVWVQKAKKSGNYLITSSEGVANSINVKDLIEENKQLKKRLARLEQEKAILKKAATYFAKELE